MPQECLEVVFILERSGNINPLLPDSVLSIIYDRNFERRFGRAVSLFSRFSFDKTTG